MPEPPVAALARRTYQRPRASVFVAERLLPNVITAHVEFGYDMAVSTATINIGTNLTSFWQEHDPIRIEMGYGGPGGIMVLVFKGEVEGDSFKYSPRQMDISAAGFAKKLQRPLGNAALETDPPTPMFTYSSQTDNQIWNDLMRRAGVPRYDAGDGDGITYATLKAYEVQAGTKPGDIISKLDESSKSGQRTFEVAGVVVRSPVLGVPSANVAWRYAEGVQGLTAPYLPIIDITRNMSNKDIQNQAVVKGVGVANETDTTPTPVVATQQAPNDKLGTDGDGNPIYVPHSLSSDFLETRDQCTDVAKRLMIEFNKETDDLTVRVALNPSIFPGQSIGITSKKMDLAGQTPYWVRHVAHDVGPSGAFTTLQCEGGAGPQGYLLGLRPIPMFDMTVTQEFFEVAGVGGMWYTVTADGGTSYDPDGTIASYAWSATNGSSGSGQVFTTRFSQAQWDDPDSAITLTVVDNDTDPTGPHTASLTQGVTGATGEDDAQVDGLYVAGNGRMDASADGGATWGTFTPPGGAHVISVTRLCPSLACFGCDDGKLYVTQDHLASAPTLLHTFASAVTAICISEIDNNKVVVGLDNGEVWMTLDAFETVPIMRRSFAPWPIRWINGSIEQLTQWRVATGSYVWITYDDFITVGTLATQANKIQQIELSNFHNYSVEDVDALVKVEVTGVPLTYPAVSPAPTKAYLANFLKDDSLMAADDQSRVYVKPPDSTAFAQVTSIAGGAVNGLMAARLNPKVFYAGTDDGLYKTYDAGQSWYRVRGYTDTGMDALQIGIDSEPVTIKVTSKIIEYVTVGHVVDPWSSGTDMGGQRIASATLEDGTEWTVAQGVRNHWLRAVDTLIDPSHPELTTAEAVYPDFWLASFDDTVSPWADGELAWGGWSFEGLPRSWLVASHQRPSNVLQRDSHMLFRHTFTIPLPGTTDNTFAKTWITMFGHEQIVKAWFNETQIHGVGSTRGAQERQDSMPVIPYSRAEDGIYTFDVSDLVVVGGSNLFACYVLTAHTGIMPGAICYRIMMNTSPTLSSATSGPSTFFMTTTEESRGYDLLDYATLSRYPNGHAGAHYLKPPPDNWTNASFDDGGWQATVAPGRFNATVPHDNADPRISLLHDSQWLGTNFHYPAVQGAGLGSAIRQHWVIPAGTYTVAALSLRWAHTIKAWLNGALVFQDSSDNPAQNPPPAGYFGKRSEMLNIDVLANIVPGQDNVLCIQVERADSWPAGWFPGDFVGACAVLELQ